VALSKIQAESMNLADTYAFTGTVSGAGGGKVLQVQSTTKTDAFSVTAGGGSGGAGWQTVTGLSVNITPSSTSSKIYVIANLNMASESGSDFSTTTAIKLRRDSTDIFIGTAGTGSQTNSGSYSAFNVNDARNSTNVISSGLDTPSTTSQITYSVQVSQGYNISGRTVFVNRNPQSSDGYGTFRNASTITVMEISE